MARHGSISGAGATGRSRSRLERLLSMGPRRCALLIEASAELALAAAVIRFRPLKRTLAFGASKLGTSGSLSPKELAEVVERAARFAPLRAVCFQQGLAYQRMARRRRIDARLHYGIGFSEAGTERTLSAHVWITVSGVGVLGHEQAPFFREFLYSPE